jgi:hypothetical protein
MHTYEHQECVLFPLYPLYDCLKRCAIAGGCSEDCRESIIPNNDVLFDTTTQARTVLSRPDIPLRRRPRVCLISNLSSKQLERPKRMEAQGFAWVQHGETSQDAREGLKEFFKWSERSGVWGWKSARLLACFLQSKQNS